MGQRLIDTTAKIIIKKFFQEFSEVATGSQGDSSSAVQ